LPALRIFVDARCSGTARLVGSEDCMHGMADVKCASPDWPAGSFRLWV